MKHILWLIIILVSLTVGCKRDKCKTAFAGDTETMRYHIDYNPASMYYQDSIVAILEGLYHETWADATNECPKCCSQNDFCKFSKFVVTNLKPEKVIAKFDFLDTVKWIEIPPYGTIEPGLPRCEQTYRWGRVTEFEYE
jgi:hypothetical protein